MTTILFFLKGVWPWISKDILCIRTNAHIVFVITSRSHCVDSKINQFYYNVLTNLSFHLCVAFDWCEASLFIFDNYGFISICLLLLSLRENTSGCNTWPLSYHETQTQYTTCVSKPQILLWMSMVQNTYHITILIILLLIKFLSIQFFQYTYTCR